MFRRWRDGYTNSQVDEESWMIDERLSGQTVEGTDRQVSEQPAMEPVVRIKGLEEKPARRIELVF